MLIIMWWMYEGDTYTILMGTLIKFSFFDSLINNLFILNIFNLNYMWREKLFKFFFFNLFLQRYEREREREREGKHLLPNG